MNFESVKMGICQAFWKGESDADFIDLGLTQGGCEFKYTPNWTDIKADQFGETPIDKVLLGETVSAKVPMLETSIEKIKMALPGSTEITVNAKKHIGLGSKPGKRASEVCGILCLHPITSNTTEDDIVIYNAINTGEMTLPFKVDAQHIIECTYEGVINPTRQNGDMLAGIGIDKATLITSSASEASVEETPVEEVK